MLHLKCDPNLFIEVISVPTYIYYDKKQSLQIPAAIATGARVLAYKIKTMGRYLKTITINY